MAKVKPICLLIALLSLLCTSLPAQNNPFITMAAKPYAAYYEKLDKTIYKDINLRDSLWLEQTTAQMLQAAQTTGSPRWKLEADFLRAEYNFHRTVYLYKPNQQEMDLLAAKLITNLTSIARKARKAGTTDIQLRTVYGVFHHYFNTIKNYELAFRHSHEVDKLLSTVSAEAFPLKPRYYFEIAILYYTFREYDKATHYFRKVLESPQTARDQRILERTWNDLGLIYRNHYKDLAASDSCFNHILTLPPDHLWAAIATGNLGHNASLRGEHDNAIPLLQYAVEKVVENNPYNYPYATSKALLLANIYLDKEDFSQARHYVGMAYHFLDQSRKNDKVEGVIKDTHYWAEYYHTMSRYHGLTHNYQKGMLYADSTLTTRAMFEDEFNLRKLHRAEQQTQQEKFDAEKARQHTYYLFALGVCTFLVLLLGAAIYHNRTIAAKNRRLYRQIKENDRLITSTPPPVGHLPFAGEDAMPHGRPPLQRGGGSSADGGVSWGVPGSPTEGASLLDRLHTYLLTDNNLTRDDINRDDITAALGTNRSTLSEAVKAVTGKTLMEYIRAMQLEEARHRLDNNPELTVEAIAMECGINPNNFYRLFKKHYGMSPAEYRKLSREA